MLEQLHGFVTTLFNVVAAIHFVTASRMNELQRLNIGLGVKFPVLLRELAILLEKSGLENGHQASFNLDEAFKF